jgi:hypothetical protein
MWQGLVITWGGKVIPYCFDKDATYRLGQLENMTFKKKWHGEEYDPFRRPILKSRSSTDICKNCSE